MHLFNKKNIQIKSRSSLQNILNVQFYKKRRGERRSKERYFNLRIQCFLQDLQCFHMQSSHPMLGNYSTYRIYSSARNLYNYKTHPIQTDRREGILRQLFPMHASILHGRTRLQGSYSTPRLPVILLSRNSILCGRQHPHTPYKIPQAHFYRILQGEIGFFPKRVKYCKSMQY